VLIFLSSANWIGAAGPTNVSGAIITNTTWLVTKSPYIVVGDVRVASGVTLTIEPGVEIRFKDTDSANLGSYPSKTELIVYGWLNATGTVAKPIIFTSSKIGPLGTDWGEIALYSSSNTIKYAQVRYATYGVHLYGTSGTPLSGNVISFVTFQHCGAEPLVDDIPPCAGGGANEIGGAIYGDYANSNTISELSIQNSERGIWLNDSDSNLIRGNQIQSMQQTAIRLSGDSDSNQVIDNSISTVTSYGIECWGASGTPGNSNTVSSNIIHDTWDTGLVFHYQQGGQVQDNEIYKTASNPDKRTCNGAGHPLTLLAGIWMSNTTSSLISDNTIYQNGNTTFGPEAAGIYIADNSTGNTIRENTIYENTGNGITVIDAGSDQNKLTQNSTYKNRRLGIDLGNDGVTANDIGDADSGPNQEQNFPIIAQVIYTATNIYRAQGTSAANAVVELFASDLDFSWHGEGKTYITSTTADVGGNWTAIFSIPGGGGILGTATATDASGNTSEFCLNTIIAGEVWVDDDWRFRSFGDLVDGHTYGVDAFATIQDGVDAVAIGGIVHIRMGTYWEQVEIEKSRITLDGAGRNLVFVRGGGITDYPTVQSSGVQTYGFAINPDQSAVDAPVNITIRGLTVEKADAGIWMPRYTEGAVIEDCGFENTVFGTFIERDAQDITISNNNYRDNEYAIAIGVHYTDTYTYTHAYNLNITNNIILQGNHQIDLQGEMVGILIWEADCDDPSSDILIANNEIRDQSLGIYLAGVSNVTIQDNYITDIPYRVTANNFTENGYGIYLYGWSGNSTCDAQGARTQYVDILTNTVTYAYKGLVSRGADDIYAQGNTIQHSRNDGVEIGASINEQARWLSAPATAIYADNNVLHGNAICGNGGYQLDNTQSVTDTGVLSATYNWWGTNLPLSGVEINNSSNVNYTPWMTMTVEAIPASMSASGTSTSILYARYIGNGYQIPDGRLVFWATSLGTITPEVSATYDGRATAELSSLEAGTAYITVTDDCGQIITLTVQALGYKPRFSIFERNNMVLANSAETFTLHEYANEADTAVLTMTFPFRFDFNMNLPAGLQVGIGTVRSTTPSVTCTLQITVSDVLSREVPIGSGRWITYAGHWVLDIDQGCTSLPDRDLWISGNKDNGWTFLLVYPDDGDWIMTTTVTTTFTISGMIGSTAVITNPACATYYPVGAFFESELGQVICRSTGVTKVPTPVWIIERYPSTKQMQRGVTNTTLPEPFVVWVHDNSPCNNPIAGVPIDFEIVQIPDGAVGQYYSVHRLTTDDSGRVLVWLTLGDKRGSYVLRARAPQYARGEVFFTGNASEDGCTVTLVAYGIDDTWVSNGESNHYSDEFLRLGDGRNDVGLRFRAPNIPQGSKIKSAVLRFSPYAVSTAAITMTLFAENVDYASAFLSSNMFVPYRPRTSASVPWAITCTEWTGWNRIVSPDITPLIQEIVDRPDWIYHNALAILMIADRGYVGTGSRNVLSYEGAAASGLAWNAPELEICYIPPWAITPEPTATPTNTASPTPSPSRTPSPTRTDTATPTGTAMYTATWTPTATDVPTATETWTATYTPTETRTPKPTPTGTVPTPTPTDTETVTPTVTRTPKDTATTTPTVTETATVTPTWTPTTVPTGEIRGVVWQDNDEDGEVGLGEPGLGGVQIILRDSEGQELQDTTTDDQGVYSFPNLLPAVYIVEEIDPPGYYSTTANSVQVEILGNDVIAVSFGDKNSFGSAHGAGVAYLPRLCR
jgi:parallel beta-helix repeat protein